MSSEIRDIIPFPEKFVPSVVLFPLLLSPTNRIPIFIPRDNPCDFTFAFTFALTSNFKIVISKSDIKVK